MKPRQLIASLLSKLEKSVDLERGIQKEEKLLLLFILIRYQVIKGFKAIIYYRLLKKSFLPL